MNYRIDGKTYELPSHGLGRISEFDFVEQTDNSITFELKYSDESLKAYPYKFSLKVQYILDGSNIIVKFKVKNLDDKKIFFSIGAHPAFMCPIEKDETLADCYLEFNKKETSSNILLSKEGYLTHTKRQCLNDTTVLNLYKDLFKDDALVFDDLKSDKITIKSRKSSKSLSVEFKGFPYMGIWAPAKGAPFVCIEPWFGHADYEDFKGDFTEKEGIMSLDLDSTFECSYKITIG